MADQAFGEKFCNEVVDPLQQGSNHWMACLSEVEARVARPISQLELVESTCEAIKDLFVREASLDACKNGGKRLIQSESFDQATKDRFARTAGSLVACYEQVGTILPSYDEEGRCSDDGELSAWTLSAHSRMTATLKSFEAYGSDIGAGAYEGEVSFYNAAGRTCTFGLAFDYSGEDITVRTRNFRCR